MEPMHGFCVGFVACELVAWAVEFFHRIQKTPFAWCQARHGNLVQVGQDVAGSVQILFAPQRVVIGHGQSPVGHRKVGLGLDGIAKRTDRIVIFKVMQQFHACHE